jgi:protocatechuate 3,4-dioxygenase, alpha subunit
MRVGVSTRAPRRADYRRRRTTVHTRISFDGETANAADPVMALVPAERRATLIATREAGNGNAVYRFDIRLQGDKETVFFDV